MAHDKVHHSLGCGGDCVCVRPDFRCVVGSKQTATFLFLQVKIGGIASRNEHESSAQ